MQTLQKLEANKQFLPTLRENYSKEKVTPSGGHSKFQPNGRGLNTFNPSATSVPPGVRDPTMLWMKPTYSPVDRKIPPPLVPNHVSLSVNSLGAPFLTNPETIPLVAILG